MTYLRVRFFDQWCVSSISCATKAGSTSESFDAETTPLPPPQRMIHHDTLANAFRGSRSCTKFAQMASSARSSDRPVMAVSYAFKERL